MKVAVVGSGCAGIGALWALKSTPHEVHLFEADHRLGGHTNTVNFKNGRSTIKVDTGFIVMNSATYPNFLAFLNHIGIKPVETEMTFGVSRDLGLFEWAGNSIFSIFAQRSNLLRPQFWRMIFDIVRFNQFALDLLSKENESEVDPSGVSGFVPGFQDAHKQLSIGEYLDQNGYSEAFRNDYLIPMTAAVWSTAPDKASLEFPAITLIRFMWNHHLLSTVAARPKWMTILGGSQPYIDAVVRDLPWQRLHLDTAVRAIRPQPDGYVVLRTDEKEDVFDHVILATHGNQALDIIESVATSEERTILSGFKTSQNRAILHSDLSLMPTRPTAWSSWNYITRTASLSSKVSTVCLTYNMNILQHIPRSEYGDVLVTLNPLWQPKSDLVQGVWAYHHPLYSPQAIRSQELLPCIQNTRGISYCGAWTKYGFHEDGFSSGLKVAMDHLGAKLPFDFVDSTFSRGRRPVLCWQDYLLRIMILTIQIPLLVSDILLATFKNLQQPPNRKEKTK